MAIKREMDDTWSIRDAGASDERKESQLFYFSSGKKAEDFYSMRVLETGPRLQGPRSGSVISR